MGIETVVVRSTLSELATKIQAEHAAVGASLRKGIKHACKAGALLTEAKRMCKHGEWLPWLKDNVPEIRVRQVQKYMRRAAKWQPNTNSNSHSIDSALEVLADLGPSDTDTDPGLLLLRNASRKLEEFTPTIKDITNPSVLVQVISKADEMLNLLGEFKLQNELWLQRCIIAAGGDSRDWRAILAGAELTKPPSSHQA